MICTEEEAKTKWCPQTLFVPTDGGKAAGPTANRFSENSEGERQVHSNPEFARCIGSACMMWVWVDMWASCEGETKPNMLGICGLIQRGAP